MFETEWSLKIQAGLELAILLPLPLKCWDCSSVLLFLAMSAYFSKVYVYFIFPRWLNCWKWLGMDHGLSGQHRVKMFRVLHLNFLILFETYCFL